MAQAPDVAPFSYFPLLLHCKLSCWLEADAWALSEGCLCSRNAETLRTRWGRTVLILGKSDHTFVLVQNDVVPRASLYAFERLRMEVKNTNWQKELDQVRLVQLSHSTQHNKVGELSL